jgi:hypothetical protein
MGFHGGHQNVKSERMNSCWAAAVPVATTDPSGLTCGGQMDGVPTPEPATN